MLNVAIVRGKVLNKWEMQDYEPLIGRVEMAAFASMRTAFPLDDILVPIKRLRSPD